jgi:hypothetical protein
MMSLIEGKLFNRYLPLFVFLFFFLFTFCLRLSTPALSSFDDPYYHARVSSALWRGDSIDPPAFSTLSDRPVDFYILYHATMAPFTFAFDGDNFEALILGVKVYHAVLDGLLFVSFFLLLRYYIVDTYRKKQLLVLLGTVFLFTFSHAFSLRIIFERPHTLIIIFMLAIFWLLERKKLRSLFFVASILPFFYSASFLALILPTIYTLASLSYYGLSKEAFKPIGVSILGLATGILARPDSFNYFYNGYLGHIFSIGRSLFTQSPNLPSELDSSVHFITGEYWLIMFIFLLFIVLYRISKNKIQSISFSLWFVSLVSVVFVSGFIMVARTIEYAYPFTLLFMFSAFPLLRVMYEESLGHPGQSFTFGNLLTELYSVAIEKKKILTRIVFIMFVLTFLAQAGSVVWLLLKSPSYEMYKSSSQFLKANTVSGDVIYIPNFGMYTQAFFYNPTLHYTLGADPVFTFLHDRSLYYEMERLNSGEIVCDTLVCNKETIDPFTLIKDRLAVAYILVDTSLFTPGKKNIEDTLRADDRFVLLFKDTEFPNMKVFGFKN